MILSTFGKVIVKIKVAPFYGPRCRMNASHSYHLSVINSARNRQRTTSSRPSRSRVYCSLERVTRCPTYSVSFFLRTDKYYILLTYYQHRLSLSWP